MPDAPLSLALGDYPMTRPLRAATLPDGTPLRFAEVKPIHRAFAPMARGGAYDVAEMAIVTALQAIAYGKPMVVLPVTLAARFQHRCLIRLASRPDITAASLPGRRVAVRAYTQTTGMWVRAILAGQGVRADSIRWLTQEGAHVAEYADPPFVTRVPEGVSLPDLLRAGEAEAAILGNDLPDDPVFAPVFDSPDAAARAWFAETGVVPVNHLLVARRDVAERRTANLAAVIAALRAAKSATTPDLLPQGEAALATAMDYVLRACREQGLLPHRLTAEEVFAPARSLGLV